MTACLPRLLIATVAIVIGIPSPDGFAQDASAIKGVLHIAGKTPVDPPPNEPKRTHAYLTIQGRGAVDMYRAMRARPANDVCRGEGWTIKRAGPLTCALARDGKEAECDFAIEVATGRLATGNAC